MNNVLLFDLKGFYEKLRDTLHESKYMKKFLELEYACDNYTRNPELLLNNDFNVACLLFCGATLDNDADCYTSNISKDPDKCYVKYLESFLKKYFPKTYCVRHNSLYNTVVIATEFFAQERKNFIKLLTKEMDDLYASIETSFYNQYNFLLEHIDLKDLDKIVFYYVPPFQHDRIVNYSLFSNIIDFNDLFENTISEEPSSFLNHMEQCLFSLKTSQVSKNKSISIHPFQDPAYWIKNNLYSISRFCYELDHLSMAEVIRKDKTKVLLLFNYNFSIVFEINESSSNSFRLSKIPFDDSFSHEFIINEDTMIQYDGTTSIQDLVIEMNYYYDFYPKFDPALIVPFAEMDSNGFRFFSKSKFKWIP